MLKRTADFRKTHVTFLSSNWTFLRISLKTYINSNNPQKRELSWRNWRTYWLWETSATSLLVLLHLTLQFKNSTAGLKFESHGLYSRYFETQKLFQKFLSWIYQRKQSWKVYTGKCGRCFETIPLVSAVQHETLLTEFDSWTTTGCLMNLHGHLLQNCAEQLPMMAKLCFRSHHICLSLSDATI